MTFVPTPLFVFSSISIIISLFTSFILFYFSQTREKNVLHKIALRHWAWAFFLFTWIRMPVVIASAGIRIVVPDFLPYYLFTSLLLFISLAIFYRGAMHFFTRNRFWLTIFPVFLFGTFWILTFIARFVFNAEVAVIALIVFLPLTAAVVLIIAGTLRYLKQLDHSPIAPIARVGTMLFILGWLIYSVLNYLVILTLMRYPADFWFIAILYSVVYLGLALVHLLMAGGLYLAGFHKDILPAPGALNHSESEDIK